MTETPDDIKPAGPEDPGNPPAGPETDEVAPRKSAAGMALMIVGPILAAIGIIMGNVKVGELCGTVFSGKHSAAELFDTMVAFGSSEEVCQEQAAAQGFWVWGLIGAGVLVFLVGVIVRSITNRPVAASVQAAPAPTAASQMEDLARLRDSGLISEEEFETKRRELLHRL
ncbi:SHOCT domain-containing protein [Arthrobacter sp. GCM10027362]|uniref:SHOCT domain-containing protein n=1 Tax=Arthrobacter sp. GCM10027362 TaxID=3273379 RepID=UPI003631CB89